MLVALIRYATPKSFSFNFNCTDKYFFSIYLVTAGSSIRGLFDKRDFDF